MRIDRNLARGLFLMAVALAFGLQSLRYPQGNMAHAGPGLFPLMVACLLFLIGVAIVVRSWLVESVPLQFNLRNIALIIGSLCGLVLLTRWVNMSVGIVFLVFCSTLAGVQYSVVRNLKVCAGLLAIAFAFQKFLGINLPLL